MAYPDNDNFDGKLRAAMNAYAQYQGNPAVTPSAAQLALAKDFISSSPITYQYLWIAGHLAGLTDASTYADMKAWLDAREAELIKLFGFGG